uniref:Uncharacterized protein n=1 Tax=Populus alba TaxID=43335 RepID=A0A4U5QJW6_POPAL|nr:hypothetical protein D5086_0000081770 [Populus alba]
MTASVLKLPLLLAFTEFRPLDRHIPKNHPSNSVKPSLSLKTPRFPRQVKARTIPMEAEQSGTAVNPSSNASMKLLFVEMGVGYDQHGQDITAAAMRACRDAISSNSIPAFRRGSIPGVTFGQMKLQIKLGVPHSLQQSLDIERVKSVFPYGEIVKFEVVDGGMYMLATSFCHLFKCFLRSMS